MKISIVIVNYNRVKETIACLTSIDKLTKNNWQLEIIVIDNNSKDNSAQIIKEKFPKIQVLESKKNLGFVGGNNLGITQALSRGIDYVVLLNDDTLIEKNALVYLIEAIQKEKKIGIVSPKIYFAPGYEYHKGRYKTKDLGSIIWYAGGRIDWQNILGIHEGLDEIDKGQFNQKKEVEFISGCCMLIKSTVFKKIGFLDKRYFLYLEDMDFCVRAARAGFKLLFVPQAIIWHKNLGTDEKSTTSRQAYYYTRNRLLFGFSYANFRAKFALVRESIKFLIKGNKWQKRGMLDFYLSRFGQGSFQNKLL